MKLQAGVLCKTWCRLIYDILLLGKKSTSLILFAIIMVAKCMSFTNIFDELMCIKIDQLIGYENKSQTF